MIFISLKTAVDAVKRPATKEIVKKDPEDELWSSLKKFDTMSCISAGSTLNREKIYSGSSKPVKLIAFISEIKNGKIDRTKK